MRTYKHRKRRTGRIPRSCEEDSHVRKRENRTFEPTHTHTHTPVHIHTSLVTTIVRLRLRGGASRRCSVQSAVRRETTRSCCRNSPGFSTKVEPRIYSVRSIDPIRDHGAISGSAAAHHGRRGSIFWCFFFYTNRVMCVISFGIVFKYLN